jgi:hypothetical protein
VSENRVLRIIFGPISDEVTEGCQEKCIITPSFVLFTKCN